MKTLLLPALLLLSYAGFSQKCTDYFYLQNNKTIEMTMTTKKGKDAGKLIYTITDLKKSGNSLTATANSELFDKKGKSVSKGSNKMECQNGTLMMDMKMFIPSAQQEQMGDISGSTEKVYLEYPSNIKTGDVLKDGVFFMNFSAKGGMNGRIDVNITERKVEAKESVTTPAGTWECFKITYHSKILFKMGIGIPFNMDVTEWYAPGFGIVKSDSEKGGTMQITSIK